MATMKLIVFAATCVCALASMPFEDPKVPPTRNTIFADEKFEGGVFENLDAIEALSRNTDASARFRLPNTTRPDHYDILWQISISDLHMNGTVAIRLYATQSDVAEIVLHAAEMEITSLSLMLGNDTIPIQSFELEAETDFLKIRPVNGTLQYNQANPVYYSLSVSFNAPLRTDMYGIYQSWYRNNASNTNEQVSFMASTQFQATAARFAFPCYDEPSFKATFDIVIRRPTAFSSWSCTRLTETRASVIAGYQEDVFGRTPIMSTYLLALIVAEYQSLTVNNANNQLIYEVIARPGAINAGQGVYALEVGQQLLAEMNNHTAKNYYGVNSNLKMTQAAIPDFSAGAMENWGLLTYREAYLLYDEQHTNSNTKQLIAYILSHEIAHMWFGNLVTCDWWDVLWLNEGFARYYQYFLTDWVEDYMGFETRFIVEQVHTSLLSDSANNPHPLSTVNIGNPASVSAMFSTISYNKGAAIIRQTEHLLGFDVHREGLRNYLNNKEFETALPIDLFEELQNVAVLRGAISEYGSDFSVIDYYKSWTEQPGHPVLNVQVNHQTGEMTIYQRRFNINTGYSLTNNNNYIVPINFATASNPNFNNTKATHILSDAITIIPRGSQGDEWVIFNIQETGFYRVNYDDYTWDLILMALRGSARTQIHQYNRAQIVNDIFSFARSGLMTYQRAFQLLSWLEFETDYAPWVAAITGFNWVRNRLAHNTTQLEQLHELIRDWSALAIGQLTYVPTANEDFMVSYFRYQLATHLCAINTRECRNSANAQFRALIEQNAEVPVDSRNWVYCNGLREGSEADFTSMWNRFLTHNVYTEKILLLSSLGCTPHQNSLNIFLDAIVQENYIIRPQDYTTAFSSAVSGNEGNTNIVFQYIQTNLTAVSNAFGSPVTPLSYVSARLRTAADILAFQTWVNNTADALGASYTSVYNGAQNSVDNLNWASETESDLAAYFQNGPAPVAFTTPAPVVPVEVTTLATPSLVEPVTPDLQLPATDAAVTTFLSVLIIALAVIVNIIV